LKDKRITIKDILPLKEKILQKQNGICPICLRDLRLLESRDRCLDHNHKTGHIRAVLCRGCNSMEGKVQRSFVRVGLKNQGVDYEQFLIGLAKYIKIKETKYIHPNFGKKEGKKRKR